MRALPLLLAALLVAGCFGTDADPRGGLVPYPRMGDVAVYEATGALLEVARWENGVPLAAAKAQIRYTIEPGGDALDGTRALHPATWGALKLVPLATPYWGLLPLQSARGVARVLFAARATHTSTPQATTCGSVLLLVAPAAALPSFVVAPTTRASGREAG